MRGNVPEPLASRFGPLATEVSGAAPAAPSSDVRERLGTAPPFRRQPSERELDQPVCCSGTVQIPAHGDITRLTC